MLPSFSKACPRTVFAFEPVLENYVLAKLCIQENRLTNVVMQNAGLGSSISVARVDTEAENGMHRGGGSQIADRGQFTALVTIDSFNIADLSIVQLDVEGYELEALRGAAKTINRSNPIIMIEDNNRNCEQFLTSVEYSYIGEIPGLMIWQSRYDGSDVRGVLSRL